MTHVDGRSSGRSFGPGDSRAAYSRAYRARSGQTAEARRPASHASGRSHHAARKKPNRSHSAVGAAIVAGAAMVATFAVILTNGSSAPPSSEGNLPPAVVTESSAPAAEQPSDANPAPAASTAKGDRKPPTTQKTTTAALPNTGPTAPAFKRGQWIAVLDTYPADTALDAQQLAKGLAGRLIKAGIPARAMLADGQYPGITNSTLEPVTGIWLVYLGPVANAEAALEICQAPKTQAAYSSLACPTYEPAAR